MTKVTPQRLTTGSANDVPIPIFRAPFSRRNMDRSRFTTFSWGMCCIVWTTTKSEHISGPNTKTYDHTRQGVARIASWFMSSSFAPFSSGDYEQPPAGMRGKIHTKLKGSLELYTSIEVAHAQNIHWLVGSLVHADIQPSQVSNDVSWSSGWVGGVT